MSPMFAVCHDERKRILRGPSAAWAGNSQHDTAAVAATAEAKNSRRFTGLTPAFKW
jgi:hypothetical protein